MPPTYIYGCGFEQGSKLIEPSANRQNDSGLSIVTSPVKTGGRAFRMTGTGGSGTSESWIRFPVPGTPTEIYIGVWAHAQNGANNNDQSPVIYFVMGDGAQNEVRLAQDGDWNAYVNGSLVASGSMASDLNAYHHLQVRLSVAASGGRFVTKIDGVTDIDFTGDTLPNADDTIDFVRPRARGVNGQWVMDNFVMATADYPGDVRFDPVLVDGDDTVQWTPSAGSNFQTIDEVPPSDSDFNSEATDAQQDTYTLADWAGSGKTPEFVTQWARAQKDEAVGHQMEFVWDDGTEDIDTPFDLSTAFEYYKRMSATKPSGGAWTETAIDALSIGQRAQIV